MKITRDRKSALWSSYLLVHVFMLSGNGFAYITNNPQLLIGVKVHLAFLLIWHHCRSTIVAFDFCSWKRWKMSFSWIKCMWLQKKIGITGSSFDKSYALQTLPKAVMLWYWSENKKRWVLFCIVVILVALT